MVMGRRRELSMREEREEGGRQRRQRSVGVIMSPSRDDFAASSSPAAISQLPQLFETSPGPSSQLLGTANNNMLLLGQQSLQQHRQHHFIAVGEGNIVPMPPLSLLSRGEGNDDVGISNDIIDGGGGQSIGMSAAVAVLVGGGGVGVGDNCERTNDVVVRDESLPAETMTGMSTGSSNSTEEINSQRKTEGGDVNIKEQLLAPTAVRAALLLPASLSSYPPCTASSSPDSSSPLSGGSSSLDASLPEDRCHQNAQWIISSSSSSLSSSNTTTTTSSASIGRDGDEKDSNNGGNKNIDGNGNSNNNSSVGGEGSGCGSGGGGGGMRKLRRALPMKDTIDDDELVADNVGDVGCANIATATIATDTADDEEENSNFMGMYLRRALPMRTNSGSTTFEETFADTYDCSTTTNTTDHSRCDVDEGGEDGNEEGEGINGDENGTKNTGYESTGTSNRELRRVVPMLSESGDDYDDVDGDGTDTLLEEGGDKGMRKSHLQGGSRVGVRKVNQGVRSNSTEEARARRSSRGVMSSSNTGSSNNRLATFPSLMDQYSSLSASASSLAPSQPLTHQYPTPYAEDDGEQDEEENEDMCGEEEEEEEEELREGSSSPGGLYNDNNNIQSMPASTKRDENDPLMATLSQAIGTTSINDVDDFEENNAGACISAENTTTRTTRTATTMILMPQDHLIGTNQHQQRHLQIHHHHHQIHHHYHYLTPPPSLQLPLGSTTKNTPSAPLLHAIVVDGDNYVSSAKKNNSDTIKIPMYDDIIVDLERINEEQSSGSFGGGTTTTPSPPSTDEAATGFHSPGRDQNIFREGNGGEQRRRRHQQKEVKELATTLQVSQLPSSHTAPQLLADQLFYAYRHQYYMEQYHYYCDDDIDKRNMANRGGYGCRTENHSNVSGEYDEYHQYDNDDEEDSTCSSVTLSQAFDPSISHHHDDDGNDVSCSSSLTDEYYHLHPPSSMPLSRDGTGLGSSTTQRRRRVGIGRATSTISRESSGSTLSSVTLSRALGRDVARHEHEHSSGGGFYVATRLGDFVQHEDDDDEVVNAVAAGGAPDRTRAFYDERKISPDAIRDEENSKKHHLLSAVAAVADNFESQSNNHKYSSSTSNHEDNFEIETVLSDISVAGSFKGDNSGNDKNINGVTTQITSVLEEISSDILTSIMPECGVPIPSVMAKVGRTRGYGVLLPWHSTRSIQNYRGSSKRGSKKRGGASGGSSDSSVNSTGRREGNIFSMSSVHTFRG